MKHTKRLFALLLTFALTAMSFGAFAAETTMPGETPIPETEIINPMHDVETYEALCAAIPEIAIDRVPEGAEEIRYSWIDGDPKIAQIQFAWGEDFYTYRAAFAEDETAKADIDGLYFDFDHMETLTGLFKSGFALNLRAFENETEAAVDWFIPAVKTQYSLFSETAGSPGMNIVMLAELIIPTDTDDASAWALNEAE